MYGSTSYSRVLCQRCWPYRCVCYEELLYRARSLVEERFRTERAFRIEDFEESKEDRRERWHKEALARARQELLKSRPSRPQSNLPEARRGRVVALSGAWRAKAA